MGSITETPTFEESIYLIQETDPVLGGEDGTVNIQPKQLTNRTAYLKALLAVQHLDNGQHAVTNEMVAANAAISESKLALDHSTTSLYAEAQANLAKINSLEATIDNIAGSDGTAVGAIGRAVPLSWKYSEYGFDFELFASSLIMRNMEDIPLIGTVAGDESVDCASTATLKVGEFYVISETDGSKSEVVQIAEILDNKRFRAVDNLNFTRTSGKVGLTSWVIKAGSAEAKNNTSFLTRSTDVLKLYNNGKLIIRRDTSAAYFNVFWKAEGSTVWQPCEFLGSVVRETGYKDDEFKTFGGEGKLRVEVLGVADNKTLTVDHLVVFPFGNIVSADEIQRPTNVSPGSGATEVSTWDSLTGSTFRSLYGEIQSSARFQVATDPKFINLVMDKTVEASVVSTTIDVDFLDTNTNYFWRVMYTDNTGNVSSWSEPTEFTTSSVFISVDTPIILSPSQGSILEYTSTLTITASNFAMKVGEGGHVSSTWQISNNASFTDIVFSSENDEVNKTSITVPALDFENYNFYYVRVRYTALYAGENLLNSEYSTVASFSGVAAGYVDNMFSTYLYKGNNSTLKIPNNVDLASKGGMVWIKQRSGGSTSHQLIDTTRGRESVLRCNESAAAAVYAGDGNLSSFDIDGFTLGTPSYLGLNASDVQYSSWTFRESPKFFDVISYTGNGVAGREISHNLGCEPGMIAIKCLNKAESWQVYHINQGATKYGVLNSNAGFSTGSVWNNTAPTTTKFTLGNGASVNASGDSYVAYVWAHDTDQAGVIQCGSIGTTPTTATVSGTSKTVTIPSWVTTLTITGRGGTGSSSSVMTNPGTPASYGPMYWSLQSSTLNSTSVMTNPGTPASYGPMYWSLQSSTLKSTTIPQTQGSLPSPSYVGQTVTIVENVGPNRGIYLGYPGYSYDSNTYVVLQNYTPGTSPTYSTSTIPPTQGSLPSPSYVGQTVTIVENVGPTRGIYLGYPGYSYDSNTYVVLQNYTPGTSPTYSTTYSTGPSASATINGSTYTFPGGYGGTATVYTHTVTLSGTQSYPLEINTTASGSYVEYSYPPSTNVSLGWEPQYVLFKKTDSSSPWYITDSMRGLPIEGNQQFLYAEQSAIETSDSGLIRLTATGFTHSLTGSYVYMAIRRSNKPPRIGTEVLDLVSRTGDQGFDVPVGTLPTPDLAITKARGLTQPTVWSSRLTGGQTIQSSDTTAAKVSELYYTYGKQQTGVSVNGYKPVNAVATYINYLFRRAPGFFDIVCYTGTGSARTVPHGLGVAPEMMIVKGRSGATQWEAYCSGIVNTEKLILNSPTAKDTNTTAWNSTSPTASVFTVGAGANVNTSAATYVAYLFATLPGISKVGSYTGTGTNQIIDCGFTTGARFVLIKRTDSTGDWYVWDTARGIVEAGNDPYLLLNSTASEVTSTNYIDPHFTGFTINSGAPASLNAAAGNYIFLAIA